MTDTLSLFFALLSAVAIIIAGVVAVGLVWRNGPLEGFMDGLRPVALWLAWAIATTATLGSLYYSEIADFPPCRYCWFQRIAMYPLALILGVAAATGDTKVRRYAAPLAAIGAALAVNHIRIQAFPSAGGSCSVEAPCSFQWVDVAGFISIPVMALAGFLAILCLVLAAGSSTPDTSASDSNAREPHTKVTS